MQADLGTCCQTPTADPYSLAYRTSPCSESYQWRLDHIQPRSAQIRQDDVRPGSTSPA